MSNSPNRDFDDLSPSGLNPLDGDLLEGMGSADTSGQLEDAGEKIEVALPSSLIEPLDETDEAVAKIEAPTAKAKKVRKKLQLSGLVARLAYSNPYTVMLAVSLAALLVGALCLLLEWGSYGFDTKAKTAQQAAASLSTANGVVVSTALRA